MKNSYYLDTDLKFPAKVSEGEKRGEKRRRDRERHTKRETGRGRYIFILIIVIK